MLIAKSRNAQSNQHNKLINMQGCKMKANAKERRRKKERGLTMASEEPSTDHWVISPFWILRRHEEDKANSTTPMLLSPEPAPADMVETLIMEEMAAMQGPVEMEVRRTEGVWVTDLTMSVGLERNLWNGSESDAALISITVDHLRSFKWLCF